jgi:hypothetical protein
MSKRQPPTEPAVSESLSVTLDNGRVAIGTLSLHVARRGSFDVEYAGTIRSDQRPESTNEAHIRAIGRSILKDLAEKRERAERLR